MTTNENEDFVLSEDVTAFAKSKSKSRGGSAVVAVRLSLEEISEIESVSSRTGKTVSQVLRDAIRNGLHAEEYLQPTITISIQDGVTTTTGASRQYGQAVVAEVRDERRVNAA